MLRLSSLLVAVVINLSLVSSTKSIQDYGRRDVHKVYNSLASLIKTKDSSRHGIITNRDQTTVLTPKLRTHVIEPKKRNIKNVKKIPKRTIQKIIKKSKKNKKSFLNQLISSPQTESTRNEAKKETTTTTKSVQKKKVKKWNSKYARYRMPFQKLAVRKEIGHHHRAKREADRDVYILEDLDEMEFLSKEDDADTIKAHVKKYW